MLTPSFRCYNEGRFVVVEIVLSAMCKVTDAAFDITEGQFTFFCRPYYLRLRFNERLAEGKGERATYNLESNTLTVYLPKEHDGEVFTQLDNPAYLLATEKQRRAVAVAVLSEDNGHDKDEAEGEARKKRSGVDSGSDDNEEDDDDDDDDEDAVDSEFVQTIPSTSLLEDAAAAAAAPLAYYGFADHFSSYFKTMDADVAMDVVDFPNPDTTSSEERRRLRLVAEMTDFDEEALLWSHADEDGEIERLQLQYKPPHVVDYEALLKSEGVEFICRSERAAPLPPPPPPANQPLTAPVTASAGNAAIEDALEDDFAAPTGETGTLPIWVGNVGEFTVTRMGSPTGSGGGSKAATPLIQEISDHPTPTATDGPNAASGSAGDTNNELVAAVGNRVSTSPVAPQPSRRPTRLSLAVPKQNKALILTTEENAMLSQITPLRLLIGPSQAKVNALTLDILFSLAYDDMITEGTHCSESLWTICKLSPSLSYLDPPETCYDACVSFARRALIYPLHRHFGIVQRVFALVGIRLLLGKSYVLRGLLDVKRILDHSEHRFALSRLFVDPLISHWMNDADADTHLTQLALEVHANAARQQPEEATCLIAGSSLVQRAGRRVLQPIHILSIGLPMEADSEEGDDNDNDDEMAC